MKTKKIIIISSIAIATSGLLYWFVFKAPKVVIELQDNIKKTAKIRIGSYLTDYIFNKDLATMIPSVSLLYSASIEPMGGTSNNVIISVKKKSNGKVVSTDIINWCC